MFKNYVTHASLNQVLLASKLNEKRKAVRAPELSATFTWDWEHTPKKLERPRFGPEQRLPEAAPLTFPLQRASLHRL